MDEVTKTEIKALFPAPIDLSFGVRVYPLTLAHYALLEKINSYLLNADHTPNQDEVLMTYYICTHESKTTLDNFPELKSEAYEWAENLPPCMVNEIANAIRMQIDAMKKVVPIISSKKKLEETQTDS